ncbi:uncharacterized protein [Parasteatoda tepidariorum]|uniref:uncharacterized protein isoform X1 n=1 Tax=Parasteatoda tepidariorum TaxID=114398 RepID=UPI001C71DC48|nr:uncharacterized protein LOC107439643 isoform X1 [Parasteatoda tepidariorum]
MASSRSKVWGPTHPSAAFLIKCAKEKEKLRCTLQNQLQEHMLCMLQSDLFSDILIGVSNFKQHNLNEENIENQQKHPDLPHLIHSHKTLLKVRTPAFYNHLTDHKEINIGVESYNSYLQEAELDQFLRRVYTDDDIRKQECETIHLSRKYIELICHNKGPLNKHVLEVDEFEKESVNSTCTDSFVTPKTSPVSPERKSDVPTMFRSAQSRIEKQKGILGNELPSAAEMKSKKVENINSNNIDQAQENDSDIFVSSKASVVEKKETKNLNLFNNDGSLNQSRESEFSLHIDLSNSDQESDSDDYPVVGSMVRSNTFDLETQGSLEEAIDDNSDWSYKDLIGKNSEERETPELQIREHLPSKRAESSGFFLHDHTPSPKSNIFRNTFLKDSYYNSAQETCFSSPNSGVQYRRIDGSMSDSGFMSHSTYSLMSDTPYPNSVSSSLIMSSEGVSNSPISNANVNSTGNIPNSVKSELPGSMFPFYIDIKKLSPPTPAANKIKKSSPSQTYMYIDAKSPKIIYSSKTRPPLLNSSYEELFTEITPENDYHKKEPLMKAQSTSRLDAYCYEQKQFELSSRNEKLRPQSCYMYVDLDSVEYDPKNDPSGARLKRPMNKAETTSVSMFIDLNEDFKEDVSTSVKNSVWDRESHQIDQHVIVKKDRQRSSTFNARRRKLSDPSLNSFQGNVENRVRYFSLTREGKSNFGADHSLNLQENFMRLKSSSQRKSRSAHRYSDGVYYDHFSPIRISNNVYRADDEKICNNSKAYMTQHIKFDNQASKLIEQLKNESSGSCSDLGKDDIQNKFLSDEKVRWKSTGDMAKTKSLNNSEENGLLPMSPILRRKNNSSEATKPPSPPISVKASTKPQDVDAMTFPKSIRDDSPKICNRETKDDNKDSKPGFPSPLAVRKKADISDDSKSSTDSLQSVTKPGFPSPLATRKKADKSDDSKSSTDSLQRAADTVSFNQTFPKSNDLHNNRNNLAGDIVLESVKEKVTNFSPLGLSLSCEFEDDSETMYSEVSDVSSSLGGVASLERRWRETQNQQSEFADINVKSTQRILEACSKLGEDLLRMFLEEIDTDITIEVEGKNIKAHRCILSVRCQYFSNLLKSNEILKDNSSIKLEGFSYLSVHFALCHIYSGAMNIPKDCDITELTHLADMLYLKSLRDVIVFHLKMHYCHFFHRPCLQCSQGVVECLPLVSACGLNELRDKCIYWLGKNFTRTWTNKSFASLPEELRDLCYEVTVLNLTIETVIDMTLNCDRLINTLPQLKWTEPIFGMITKLLQDCIHFMAKNFNQILKSEGFLALGKGLSWNVTALEEDIISAIELTAPDMTCKSFDTVNQLIQLAESIENIDSGMFTQNFVDLLHKISRHCERYLIQNANKVVHCQSWAYLAPHVQKRIRDAAVIVFEFEKPTAPPPRLSSLQRKLKKQNETEEPICIERSTYPKKGKSPNRKQQQEISPKNNPQCNPEVPERNVLRRDSDCILKKIVSPIKEEVNYNSIDNSSHDLSYDIPPCVPHQSQLRNNLLNRVYLDAHEEDSLRDLQDLPQDQTQSNHYEPESESQMISSIASLELDDSKSPAHCSDNPDSLEANEEISTDSKDEIDISASADGSSQEKGANEKPEVVNKNSIESVKKGKTEIPVKANSPPPSIPQPTLIIQTKEQKSNSKIPNQEEKVIREKSPVKRSLVPTLKTYTSEEKLPLTSDLKGKDLVAEIDADSRMVSHCLQEAEMLEQQLSRKLQRQHQDGSTTGSLYLNSPARIQMPSDHKTAKTYGSRLQKASSTSQIKNLVTGSSRGRSPGRTIKSNASSPSVGHPPKLVKCSESVKDKMPVRKSSVSPKNTGLPNSSYRPGEAVSKQGPISVHLASKRMPTRVNRSKIITVTNARTSASGSK